MKEFIEKLIGRLEEEKEAYSDTTYYALGVGSAIKIVNQLAEEYNTKDCSKCSRRSWYQKGYADAEKKFAEEMGISKIENTNWIPCSERLPEESELVLIYAESRARGGSIRVVGHLHNGFWFAQTSSDTLGLTGIGQFDVIAWMPLPAPFKKGE